MAKFQSLAAFVALGGDNNNTVARGVDNPLTLPEVMILRVLHGGEAKVHGVVVVGEVERSDQDERQRLTMKYGNAQVNHVFPVAMALPLADEMLPHQDEVNAALQASNAALADARAKRGKPKAKAAAPALTPAGADPTNEKSGKKPRTPAQLAATARMLAANKKKD